MLKDRRLSDILEELSLNPNNYNVWIELSLVYLKTHLHKESIAAASRAIQIAPYNEISWLNRASIYNKLEDHSLEEDDLTQAIVIYTVKKDNEHKNETLKLRAHARSIIADYQGAIDDVLLIKKYHKLDIKTKYLLQYCEAALLKDI